MMHGQRHAWQEPVMRRALEGENHAAIEARFFAKASPSCRQDGAFAGHLDRAERNLVRMARRVVLVADFSKWDIGASSKAFSLSRVDLIITDSNMPHSIRNRVEKLGVEVRYA
jgi:DeoR/GlpR family transcriptional regulator of sugar metabolism